ncbi:hypothetical protein LNAOJCKE_4582 [Methylorubrum aminovorans]|uniref:Uncharacterized protein n=1 Tax=Methylorubrum aminovorans TaxID=269069 RepID=A0ABQ4UJ50_9HYPH|nr:hypothetical protein [Methylorubrum aminovorans]GJE67351.1 hypothetical protein LNAOJCKE_4582 [Methylorubrum aminovorans]GMA74408.1 hypothetical protein GCM10025880_08250 [Methylorubrum aminovorans]
MNKLEEEKLGFEGTAQADEAPTLLDPFSVPLAMVDGVAGISIMNGNIDATLAHIRGVPSGGLNLRAEWIISARIRLTLAAAIDIRDKLNAQIAMLTIRPDEKPN